MENIFNISTSELIAILSALPAVVISVILLHLKFLTKLKKSFAFDGHFFLVGLAIGISASVALLNWTTYEAIEDYVIFTPDDTPEMTVQVPTSVHVVKNKLPPPPKKKIQPLELKKIITVDVVKTQEVEMVDMDETESVIEQPTMTSAVQSEPAPIVVPIIEKEEEEGFITVAEQMPRFPGCEHLDADKKEKEACSKKALLQYVKQNLRYPKPANENRIEGLVVVQFIVAKSGAVEDVTIVRDIGGGCGKEAARVVKMMNDLPEAWIPGRQRGRAVNVKYTLPVNFKLN